MNEDIFSELFSATESASESREESLSTEGRIGAEHQKIVSLCRDDKEEAAALDAYIHSDYDYGTALECLRQYRSVNLAWFRNRKRRGQLIPRLERTEPAYEDPKPLDLSLFTERQRRIIKLRMQGYQIAEVAQILGRDRGTIRREIERIKKIILRSFQK